MAGRDAGESWPMAQGAIESAAVSRMRPVARRRGARLVFDFWGIILSIGVQMEKRNIFGTFVK